MPGGVTPHAGCLLWAVAGGLAGGCGRLAGRMNHRLSKPTTAVAAGAFHLAATKSLQFTAIAGSPVTVARAPAVAPAHRMRQLER